MKNAKTLHKKLVKRYYQKRAKDYDKQKARTWKSKTGFETKILEEILNATKTNPCHIGLEIGIGSGRITIPYLQNTSLHMVGIDLTKEMLKITKQKGKSFSQKLDLALSDAEFLPFRNNTFDLLVCISVFHYFPAVQPVLSEFSRTLRVNGLLVFGDLTLHEKDNKAFMNKLEKALSPAHKKFFKLSEITKMLENVGYKIEKIITIPYRKSFLAMWKDKAKYFKKNPQHLTEILKAASKEEKTLYDIKGNGMTLFYAIVILRKCIKNKAG